MTASSNQYEVTPMPRLGAGIASVPARIAELWRYRSLVRNLTARDLTARYKGSILGFLWTFMNPLFMTLVFTLVFSVILQQNTVPYYPLFILIGVLTWNLHQGAVMGGMLSIPTGAGLITKVYFPREALPIASVLANTINFVLGLLVVFIFILALGVPQNFSLLWFPLVLLIQVVFTVGLAMLLATLNVFLKDTAQIMETVMLAWFFMTPIFYQASDLLSEGARWLFILNPVASIVTAYREILLYGNVPDGLFMVRVAAQAVVVAIVGGLVFLRFSGRFVEEL
jgi:ABC-type polysaccharide/polyol phosphate export permease